MAQSRYDLILHPVRLQILHALERKRRMTLEGLVARLGDVASDTVARQVQVLVASGMLVEVHDGAETLYEVGDAIIPAYDRRRATPADHIRYFTTFVAGLIQAFTRYVKRPDADVVRDRITYRQRSIFLTDAELERFLDDIEARLDQEEDDPSRPGRKAHIVSWIVLPETHGQDMGEG